MFDQKYGEKNHDLLFWRMIKYRPSVSCDINNVTGLNDIVKPCSAKMILTPVRKDANQNAYFRQHTVHLILRMWMPSNFDLYNMILSTIAKFNRMVRNVF